MDARRDAQDPWSRLRRRCRAGEAVVAGCLSGTSADGIDVVLARARPWGPDGAPPAPEALAFATLPFPGTLGARVRAVLDGAAPAALDGGEGAGWGAIARLDRELGHAFGSAARALAERAGLALDLVASHGQTVWHHDGHARTPAGRASVQLGGGAHVAAAARAHAVTDFRQADLARGGEGAPVSALVDGALFPDLPRPVAILNLGGMANLTFLKEGERAALAFDTGPAGSLLDGLARRLLGRPLDEDGGVAATGTPDPALVAAILAHPFFDRRPPKSTGRDTFGEAWLGEVLARAGDLGVRARGPADVLASAVEALARSIGEALERFLDVPCERLVVAGGGVHHRPLLAAIGRHAGVPAVSSAAYGVDPDAREALVFALLGLRFVAGVPSTVPLLTGAGAGGILGALHLWGPPGGTAADPESIADVDRGAGA